MQQLEVLYESTPKAVPFIERKIEIPSHTVNLYGPPASGKTWLVLDYLSKLPKKKRLYIDLKDLRIDIALLSSSIQAFIDENGIECVVFDHYEGQLELPVCKQAIVVTRAPFKRNRMMPLLLLPTLDFEEFLAFEKRHTSLEHSFSSYIRVGSLPEISFVHDSQLTMKMHKIARDIFRDPTELTLFKHISRFQGKPVTSNQLYTLTKRVCKVSKDRVYNIIKSWEELQVLSWVPKQGCPKAAKRAVIFDFALTASMYFEKSLMGQLYAIAAKKLTSSGKNAAYTDSVDLVDVENRKAVLISPFANQQSAAAKVAYAAEDIDKFLIEDISILTLSNSFTFTFEKIEVKALPFYEWIMQDI